MADEFNVSIADMTTNVTDVPVARCSIRGPSAWLLCNVVIWSSLH